MADMLEIMRQARQQQQASRSALFSHQMGVLSGNPEAMRRQKLAQEMTHQPFDVSGMPQIPTLADVGRFFVEEVAPGSSDVVAAQRGAQAMREALAQARSGNWLNAAGKGAEGLTEYISTVPGIGEIAMGSKLAGGMIPFLGMTKMPSTPKKYYHVANEYDGDDLLSLYKQYGDDAYDMYATRWPDSDNLGSYHAHYIHLHDSLDEAQKYADYFGGNVLEITPDDGLEIVTDTLEYPHPVVRDIIPKKYIKAAE